MLYKNKCLVSCSDDQSSIFYIKDNNEYIKDYQVSTNGGCTSVIQTNDNEICYSKKKIIQFAFFIYLKEKLKQS